MSVPPTEPSEHFEHRPPRRDSGLQAHWNETIRGLDLRGILLAGMAVFLTYFQLDTSVVPEFFVINAWLTTLAFAVVVCRFHVFQSIEPDMSAWWDETIVNNSRAARIADFAMEGPWLFFLMAMPFSTISMVAFGATYLAWSMLECCFLWIGKRGLERTPRGRLGSELTQLVERYYVVRLQHEALAAAIAALVLAAALLATLAGPAWLWVDAAALAALIVLLTVAEVARNPWFNSDLSLVHEVPANLRAPDRAA